MQYLSFQPKMHSASYFLSIKFFCIFIEENETTLSLEIRPIISKVILIEADLFNINMDCILDNNLLYPIYSFLFLLFKISSLRPFSTYLTGDCAFESLILSNYWILNEPVNEQKRSHFLPEGIIYGPFLNPFKNGFARDSQHVFI